jgi:hypothetical protein
VGEELRRGVKDRRKGENMKIKKVQEDMVVAMKEWQKMEDASILSTAAIMMKTENPFIRLVMGIIQRDSQMHYLIQEWIGRSLTTEPATLTQPELVEVWKLIEEHVELEKQMVDIVKNALGCVKGNKMALQEYLLDYLQEDEVKHNKLLKKLDTIKHDMLM